LSLHEAEGNLVPRSRFHNKRPRGEPGSPEGAPAGAFVLRKLRHHQLFQ
jgi:hypothetical protein